MNAKFLSCALVLTCATQIAACERNAVSFSADVQPILEASCVSCHMGASTADADKASMGEGAYVSGFSLADYGSLMKGTSLGPMVVPGSRLSSSLYLTVAGKTDPAIRMPPHHDESLAEGRGAMLSAAQIEAIGAWIDQGAKDN